MLMIPRKRTSIERVKLLQFMLDHDIHKWIIAEEVGNQGLKHWQVRIQTSLSFNDLKTVFPNAHIEKCSDTWDYERKEGKFYTSEDTIEIMQCRYATLRENQRKIIERVMQQSDRGITVVIDSNGNTGKSYLCRHLYEIGRAFYCPPTLSSTQSIIQFIASGYTRESIIVIDIPRSAKWSADLYTAIECIKDGMIYDGRYSTKIRDIFGVKVLVLTNTKPKLDRLSLDRWELLDERGEPLS